ncbi:testis-expressed protein 36-like [Acanthaster planci]|uniref:Testis-expressed protein 36-like n=1 Tax=Acanthaster planci TaxID=133434 RepID=A0A8B7XIV4_ACAPL|nr:testis-expressed protein 36-like [Acanthaster planci]
MPKSRACVPSASNDGIWFRTRGWSDPPMMRDTMTSTGSMLSTSLREQQPERPKPPPEPFNTKIELSYTVNNPFSMHDNRNSFQDHGVYFGHGLGKRLFHGDERQHGSKDFYTWDLPEQDLLSTNYRDAFPGRPCRQPPTRRRFPRQHSEPKHGQQKLDTTTTDWFRSPDVPYKTETQTLVSSQEPHLKPNPWKYSYKAY